MQNFDFFCRFWEVKDARANEQSKIALTGLWNPWSHAILFSRMSQIGRIRTVKNYPGPNLPLNLIIKMANSKSSLLKRKYICWFSLKAHRSAPYHHFCRWRARIENIIELGHYRILIETLRYWSRSRWDRSSDWRIPRLSPSRKSSFSLSAISASHWGYYSTYVYIIISENCPILTF